jgi:hypothetical protein
MRVICMELTQMVSGITEKAYCNIHMRNTHSPFSLTKAPRSLRVCAGAGCEREQKGLKEMNKQAGRQAEHSA